MKIAPRTGMIVIDPATSQALPADGADVEMSSYWRRRLNDGDVEEQEKPAAAQPRAQRRTRKKGTEEGI